MSKIKKILISVIVGLIVIFGSYTISQAEKYANEYDVGDTQYIKASTRYYDDSNLFCVEHKQKLYDGSYKVVEKIIINGFTSTDHNGGNPQSNWHNAKLAYILSADNGSNRKTNGPVAHAIWYYMDEWMKNVGNNYSSLDNFSVLTKNEGTATCEGLLTEADNYANNLSTEERGITDNTDQSNIKLKAYTKDGKNYVRVGPFNWSFPGTMSEVIVNDQNGNAISGILYSSYNGNDQYWYNADGITSGKNFYISVPMDSRVSMITSITGKININIKNVTITFLQPVKEGTGRQNFILRNPSEGTETIPTIFNYDIPLVGDLAVIKVNKDNHDVTLSNVGFEIEQVDTGLYVYQDANGNIAYRDKNKEKITTFKTDGKGELTVENLQIGEYILHETINPHYGYESNKTFTVEVKAGAKAIQPICLENPQIYVKLSGYVWVDQISPGKASEMDGLYKKDDSPDILFNGITVRLKDRKTNKTIKETVTSKLDRYKDSVNNGNGEYLFEDVLIKKLEDYYIEFEYDGLTYTNVVPHIDQNRGSKAAESETERDNFNKNFSVVEGATKNTGFTRDDNGNKKHDLSYNINESQHEATLINNGQYTITANTDASKPSYSIRNNFTYGQEEVKYINLGLCKREQPDLRLKKDLYNVKVSINGYNHIYKYADRFEAAGVYNGNGFNVGVEFGITNRHGGTSYTRALYKSDYEYRNESDSSKELQVYVTYQLLMLNESDGLTARINSIVDYYDSEYTIEKIGTSCDEHGNIIGDISHTESNYNENYKKTIINNNTRIEAQKGESIYVQFKLSRSQVAGILHDKDIGETADELLENVAEINSYSIYKENKIYAGIDIDSNPGNCIPGETRTYEDDTDASLGLRLEVAGAREMTGKVFEDEVVPEEGQNADQVMTGKVRQGSGKYEDGEKGISGVEVTLTENTGSGKIYTATTQDNGDFFIADYIPGNYTLTYTWGDETYKVQDYKGTVYDTNRNQNNKKWYKENENERFSDAIDNYNQNQDGSKGSREQIDAEIANVDKNNNKDNDSNITKTKMDSTTPEMAIGVEKGNDTNDLIYTISDGDELKYQISNLDFGIVERAKQDLALTKRIKTMKVTLTNGQVITDLTINEDGTIEGEKKNITYMKPSANIDPNNGFIKLELDNELIQGAKLEIGYEIKATNNSELDYKNEDFYKYGTNKTNVITITPTGIIDYLDKDWAFDSEQNSQWTVITEDSNIKIEDLVAEVVYNNEESTIGEKMILYTDYLAGENIEPNDSRTVMLNVSKKLTTTDEISLDNETEIVELDRPGGSTPQSVPGNYVPGEGAQEADDSMAETTIVTPATGEDQNYIIPIIVGTTALIILGAGIVIIKKKIL